MRKDRLIPCWIHIPCQYPDGTEVEPEKLNEFLMWFDRQFGGSTPLGIVPGRWVSPEGKTVAEPMLRVEVSIKESEVALFEAIGRRIRKETKQEAIYVVINPAAETKLLFDKDELDESTGSGAKDDETPNAANG